MPIYILVHEKNVSELILRYKSYSKNELCAISNLTQPSNSFHSKQKIIKDLVACSTIALRLEGTLITWHEVADHQGVGLPGSRCEKGPGRDGCCLQNYVKTVTHRERLLSSVTFNTFKIPLTQGQAPDFETKSEEHRKGKACGSILDCLEMKTVSFFNVLRRRTIEKRQRIRY